MNQHEQVVHGGVLGQSDAETKLFVFFFWSRRVQDVREVLTSRMIKISLDDTGSLQK